MRTVDALITLGTNHTAEVEIREMTVALPRRYEFTITVHEGGKTDE